jgi:leucyl-tRNA synthetase
MTDNLTSFSYNIIIANFHEMYSFYNKEIKNGYTKKTIEENYHKILLSMMPVIPHFALECIEKNNFNLKFFWPSYDKELLIDDRVNYVVQINGKKRALIETKRDLDQIEVFKEINLDETVIKYLKNKKITKKIFIKNKLINIII